ncbi:hypothetical protein BP5796_12487 [Coleophoma crateriformis]|uniref:Uncharacterized protein n=1 Tax=Coleophoma crateriformis TaxID=565419 RepID=A0A3D8Q776_9HELO|nr:hypothetical protein BP5796_12487 [Coleophoma crateriformis]
MKNNESKSLASWPDNATAESIAANFRKSARPAPLATSKLPAFPISARTEATNPAQVPEVQLMNSKPPESTEPYAGLKFDIAHTCMSGSQTSTTTRETPEPKSEPLQKSRTTAPPPRGKPGKAAAAAGPPGDPNRQAVEELARLIL